MSFQSYLKKVKDSKEFERFMKEHTKAYFCSGFFTIDKENSLGNEKHIDFYSPKTKKVYSFKVQDKNVESEEMDMVSEKVPEKVPESVDFEIEDVERLVLESMGKNNVKNKLQKIMISLQNVGEKNKRALLVCTVFVSMLGILKVHINPKDKKVILFEKKSFFDLVRKG